MLKPYLEDGEFIHSFIFRVQDAVGVKDYANLLSSSGRWKEYVYINQDTKFIFDNHTEQDFILLLRNTGFDKKYSPSERARELSKPKKYLEDVSKLLNPTSKPYGVKVPNYISRDIRYCEHCITDMFNQHGMAFFKGEWQVSKSCRIHRQPLHQLTLDKKSSSVESIKMLLRGNLPENSKQLTMTQEDTFMSPSIYNQNQ